MAEVLIIDDDRQMCKLLAGKIRFLGHNAAQASTLAQGIAQAETRAFDVIFLDIYMPDGNGIDAIPALRGAPSRPEIIIITGRSDRDSAETAIGSGAWDYVQKGDSLKAMMQPLARALQYRQEMAEQEQPAALRRSGIVGDSPALERCLGQLSRVAASDISVHVTGETGTGKEVFARALHENSARAERNFVVVDCAAIPDHLAESILFGSVKGAFTGAHQTREGLLKQADGGTVFLDEVGELPLSMQKAFLRALQEHRFRPVGAEREIDSDFRLVSATNRNLEEMVAAGQFRKDLLYRIRSQEIELPPLRERGEDIRALTLHHLRRLEEKHGMAAKGVSSDFWDAMAGYRWPGNIRELINVLEGAVLAAKEAPTLFAMHLPTAIRLKAAEKFAPGPALSAPAAAATLPQEGAVSPNLSGEVPGPAPAASSAPVVPSAIGGIDGGAPVPGGAAEPIPEVPPREMGTPQLPFAEAAAEPLKPLKEARADVIARFETAYLTRLLEATDGNIKASCAIAGVSRQHLHNLIQKYGIRRPDRG